LGPTRFVVEIREQLYTQNGNYLKGRFWTKNFKTNKAGRHSQRTINIK